MLTIRLLGNFQITHNGRDIPQVSRDRYKALFAYLVLHRDAPQARRFVAMRFWPESSEAQAMTNLRKLLVDLRKSFPEVGRFLSVTEQQLAWKAGTQYIFDVAEFEQAIERAEQTTDVATA